jgi:hypothetical protein
MTTLSVIANPPTEVRKRDGRVVSFEPWRIERAIGACYEDCEGGHLVEPQDVTAWVESVLSLCSGIPSHDQIQDLIEIGLQQFGEHEAAKRYILHRAEKDRGRAA